MKKGYFGEYGGSFVPPQLQNALDQLEDTFETYKDDPAFNKELDYYLRQYVGRPNPLCSHGLCRRWQQRHRYVC